MSGQELLPKLPGDVQAVLDVERELRHHESLGDDVQQRLRRRLEVSVGILALGVGAAATTTTASTGAASGAAAVTKAGLLTKPWVVAAIAFVLGGAAGAGLHAYARKLAPPAPAQVTTVVVERRIEVPVAASATTIPSVPSPAEGTLGAQAPANGTASPPPVAGTVSPGAQSGVAVTPSSASGSSTDTALAAERSLLEVARTALSRGDTASALASLDQHAKKFPGGQLTEEREALYVQALARAGRMDEARARAAKFAKRFPESMLLPVVEAATE